MDSSKQLYRGYKIQPAEMGMWSWTHVNYDGPEDRRCGIGKDEAECRMEVDEQIAEFIDNRLTIIATNLSLKPANDMDRKTARAIRDLLWNASTETVLKIVDEIAPYSGIKAES